MVASLFPNISAQGIPSGRLPTLKGTLSASPVYPPRTKCESKDPSGILGDGQCSLNDWTKRTLKLLGLPDRLAKDENIWKNAHTDGIGLHSVNILSRKAHVISVSMNGTSSLPLYGHVLGFNSTLAEKKRHLLGCFESVSVPTMKELIAIVQSFILCFSKYPSFMGTSRILSMYDGVSAAELFPYCNLQTQYSAKYFKRHLLEIGLQRTDNVATITICVGDTIANI